MTKKNVKNDLLKKVVVLIPCYNEEKTIEKVIKDFKSEIKKIATIGKYMIAWDVVVYDNASTDTSAAKILKSRVKYRYEADKGKGNVVASMFQNENADVYVLVDGDSTYFASDLKKIVEPVIIHNVDMVIGDRLSSTYFTENKRKFHNFGNKLVNWLINVFYKVDIKDTMTGFRSLSKELAKSLVIKSEGFQVETEMTIFSIKHNFRILSIPINYKDRPSDSPSKLNTCKDGMKVLSLIFKNFFKDAILEISMLVALIFIFLKLFKLAIFILMFGCVLSCIWNSKQKMLDKQIVKTIKEVNNDK